MDIDSDAEPESEGSAFFTPKIRICEKNRSGSEQAKKAKSRPKVGQKIKYKKVQEKLKHEI